MRAFDAYVLALREVLSRDPMTAPRLAAVERLGQARPDPRAAELLRSVAANDADEDARNAAEAILAACTQPSR